MNDSLLPKHLTGASQLLERTGCDGTNVVVAVLDTGVDPGAAGLEKTPDGRRKIIDIVDCTGDGDVNMSTVAVPNSEFIITGTSGRNLRLGKDLCDMNPSKEFHVGSKLAYQFLPPGLISRMKKEREDEWSKINEKVLKTVVHEISELKLDQNIDKESKKMKMAELEAKKELLLSAKKNYEDLGPIYDCVTFFDGKIWRAVVNTDEDGNFAKCKILEDYKLGFNYVTIGNGILLNYCVNIYEEGNVLSIVVDTGTHGTHVAGIISAYFPDSPEMNGIAPGAQIVSLKVGDARLSGMETHQGIMQAMGYLLQNSAMSKSDIRVDIANMSYGEPSRTPDSGSFIEAMRKLVRKHNVMFVSSAGNNGPALSTLSAPGGTSSDVLGVAAYVTKDMMLQAYSNLKKDMYGDKQKESSDMKKSDMVAMIHSNSIMSSFATDETFDLHESKKNFVPGLPYTWSSRGPTFHGASGVNICAPGGAIAPVSQWSLQKKQLMNGTSMSSPSAAGAIAMLVSFLKKKNIAYSTSMLHRVIEHTARPLAMTQFRERIDGESEVRATELIFGAGAGSIDVLLASQYMEIYEQQKEDGGEHDLLSSFKYWNFDVSISEPSKRTAGSLNTTKGIYLRGFSETHQSNRFTVTVTPSSPDDENSFSKEAKANMEITLIIESSETWVTVPDYLVLTGKSRKFPILVDPTSLNEGIAHHCKIFGYLQDGNGEHRKRAPLFSVPVTVVKPEKVQYVRTFNNPKELIFSGGAVFRRFIQVPYGATLMKLKIISGNNISGDEEYKTNSTETLSESSEAKTASEKYEKLTSVKDSRGFIVHVVQVTPTKHYRECESKHRLSLRQNGTEEIRAKVMSGKVVEICVSQEWSSPGCTKLEKFEVEFGGFKLNPSVIVATGMSKCFDELEVSNQIDLADDSRHQSIPPQVCKLNAVLQKLHRMVCPQTTTFKVLGNRHFLPEFGKVIRMKLEYIFEVKTEASVVSVTFPELNRSVYEAEIQGGPFCFIKNSNGRIMRFSDIYPKTVKLSRGEYSVDAYLSSTNYGALEDLKDLRAQIVYNLDSSIDLVPYKTRNEAVLREAVNGKSLGPKNIEAGEGQGIFFSAPEFGKIPDWAISGDELHGKLTVDSQVNKKNFIVPTYKIQYLVQKTTEPMKHDGKSMEKEKLENGRLNTNDTKSEKKDTEKWLTEEIVSIKNAKLKKLILEKDFRSFDELYRSMLTEGTDSTATSILALERAELEILESEINDSGEDNKVVDTTENALKLAESVLESLNSEEIASNLYKKSKENKDQSGVSKKIMMQEGQLITVLFRKARILSKSLKIGSFEDEKTQAEACTKFLDAFKELEKWVKFDKNIEKNLRKEYIGINHFDFVQLAARKELINKRPGHALNMLEGYSAKTKKTTDEIIKLRTNLLKQLGWNHIAKNEYISSLVEFQTKWDAY